MAPGDALDMSRYSTMAGGLVMLSAPPGMLLDAFRAEIARRFDGVRAALGDDVEVRVGTRFAQDPLGVMLGDRAMAPADAIIDLAMPGIGDPLLLASRLEALRELAGCIDPAASSLALGTLCYIHRTLPEGREILSFIGRKSSETTVADMRRWWLEEHAQLALRLQNGIPRPWSYAQLHVDRAASEQGAARSGLSYVHYDMGDLIAIADRAQFLDFHSIPEVARALEEDEKGFLDQSSWRGAIVEQL